MLHSHYNNNKIQHVYERCLRLIYNDKSSSYEELLAEDKSVSTQHRNLQCIATEILKIKIMYLLRLYLNSFFK